MTPESFLVPVELGRDAWSPSRAKEFLLRAAYATRQAGKAQLADRIVKLAKAGGSHVESFPNFLQTWVMLVGDEK